MKSNQNDDPKDLELYRQIDTYNIFQNEDLLKTVSNRRHLIAFFNYLKNNKIKYEILTFIPKSILLLKLLTLNPKYLTIVINESDSKKFLVNYEDLNTLKTNFLRNDEIKRNSYIIFLDSSISSIREVRKKTLYANFKKISLREEFKRIINTNTKILIKKELRSGLPFGKYYKRNKLNELTGKEWIKFTKSWFIYNPPPRSKSDLYHPAKFPESLIEKFIRFFTKEREIVLDPFIGTGSTAIAAKNTFRSCIGFEINKNYVEIAKSKLKQNSLDHWMYINKDPLFYKIIHNDSNNLETVWAKKRLPFADFCITSPPYWNQLKRDYFRQDKRKRIGLDTNYSEDPRDIAKIDNYKEFLIAQKNIFDKVYMVLKRKSCLVIITNNLFYDGSLYPLAFDTARSLSNKWVLKDEKIWCQDDKRLIPLGVNNSYVGNRHHVYCLVFRKEEN